MKVTLESTTKIVTLVLDDGQSVPARVWEGFTEHGIGCHAFITRIVVREGENAAEFVRDLEEQRTPSAAVEAMPLRMIL